MCATPQRSRSTSTGSFKPASTSLPSSWARTDFAFVRSASDVFCADSWLGSMFPTLIRMSMHKTRRMAFPRSQTEITHDERHHPTLGWRMPADFLGASSKRLRFQVLDALEKLLEFDRMQQFHGLGMGIEPIAPFLMLFFGQHQDAGAGEVAAGGVGHDLLENQDAVFTRRAGVHNHRFEGLLAVTVQGALRVAGNQHAVAEFLQL